MKKILLTLAAIPAATLALEASAQTLGVRADTGIQNRIMQLETRFNAGVQSGAIDRREARTLRTQLRELTRLERRYSRDGLTREERQDLRSRIQTLRQQVRVADRGPDWGRDDWDYGYSDQRYPGQTYSGQGGPYEVVEQEDRGLIGNLIQGIFGGGGLTVGQRVTGSLGPVPYGYSGQFRDGNGAYYRSDGQRIYQIDARTHTVTRVYSVPR